MYAVCFCLIKAYNENSKKCTLWWNKVVIKDHERDVQAWCNFKVYFHNSPFEINSFVFHYDDFHYGRRITAILCLIIATQLVFSITYNNTVKVPVCLKSLIDVLICKLHFGFGGIRHLTISRQVGFAMFSLKPINRYVQKLDIMPMIDWCKDYIFVVLMY